MTAKTWVQREKLAREIRETLHLGEYPEEQWGQVLGSFMAHHAPWTPEAGERCVFSSGAIRSDSVYAIGPWPGSTEMWVVLFPKNFVRANPTSAPHIVSDGETSIGALSIAKLADLRPHAAKGRATWARPAVMNFYDDEDEEGWEGP